ncbi:hypothetical protein ACHWQZ_G005938 [Mnemiopsis leidyi]
MNTEENLTTHFISGQFPVLSNNLDILLDEQKHKADLPTIGRLPKIHHESGLKHLLRGNRLFYPPFYFSYYYTTQFFTLQQKYEEADHDRSHNILTTACYVQWKSINTGHPFQLYEICLEHDIKKWQKKICPVKNQKMGKTKSLSLKKQLCSLLKFPQRMN